MLPGGGGAADAHDQRRLGDRGQRRYQELRVHGDDLVGGERDGQFRDGGRHRDGGQRLHRDVGTLTFTSGGPVTQTITVQVIGDTLVEPNETFFVNLSGAAGATIADAQGLGTIIKDDSPPPSVTVIPTLGTPELIALIVLLALAGWNAQRRRRR
jgi:hypothetical protein